MKESYTDIPPIIALDYRALIEKINSPSNSHDILFIHELINSLLKSYSKEKLPTIFLLFTLFYMKIGDLNNARCKLKLVSLSKNIDLNASLVANAFLIILDNETLDSQTITNIINSLEPLFEPEKIFDQGFMAIVKALCEKVTPHIQLEKLQPDDEELYYNFIKKLTTLFLVNKNLTGFVFTTQFAYQLKLISCDNLLNDFKNIIAKFDYVHGKKLVLEFYLNLLGFFKLVEQSDDTHLSDHIKDLVKKYLEFKTNYQLEKNDIDKDFVSYDITFLFKQINQFLQNKIRFQKYPIDADRPLSKMFPFAIRLLQYTIKYTFEDNSDDISSMAYQMLLYQSALNSYAFEFDNKTLESYQEQYDQLTVDIPDQLSEKAKTIINNLAKLNAYFFEINENLKYFSGNSTQRIDHNNFSFAIIKSKTGHKAVDSILKKIKLISFFELKLSDASFEIHIKTGILATKSMDEISELVEKILIAGTIIYICQFVSQLINYHHKIKIASIKVAAQNNEITFNLTTTTDNDPQIFSYLVQSSLSEKLFVVTQTIQRNKNTYIIQLKIKIHTLLLNNEYFTNSNPLSRNSNAYKLFINNCNCLIAYKYKNDLMFSINLTPSEVIINIRQKAWKALNQPQQLRFANLTTDINTETKSFQVDIEKLYTQEDLFAGLQSCSSQITNSKLSASQQIPADSRESCDDSLSHYNIPPEYQGHFNELRNAIIKRNPKNMGSSSHFIDHQQIALKTIYDLILSITADASYKSGKGSILLLFASAYYIIGSNEQSGRLAWTAGNNMEIGDTVNIDIAKMFCSVFIYKLSEDKIESDYILQHKTAINTIDGILSNQNCSPAQMFLIEHICEKIYENALAIKRLSYQDSVSLFSDYTSLIKTLFKVVIKNNDYANQICLAINFLYDLKSYDLVSFINEITPELNTLSNDDAAILGFFLQLVTFCKEIDIIDLKKACDIVKQYFIIKTMIKAESKNHLIIQNEINKYLDKINVRLNQNKKSLKLDEKTAHAFYLIQLLTLHDKSDMKNDLQRLSLEHEVYKQHHPINSEHEETFHSLKEQLLGSEFYQTLLRIANTLNPLKLEHADQPGNEKVQLSFYCPIQSNYQHENIDGIVKFLTPSFNANALFQITSSDQHGKLFISIALSIFSASNTAISQNINRIVLINHLIETYFSIIDFAVKVLKCEVKFDEKRGFLININENSEPFLLYRAIAQISSIKNLYELKRIKNHFFMTPNQRTISNIHNQNNLSLSLNPSNIHLQEANRFKENFSSLKNFCYQQNPVFHLPENPDSSTDLSITLNSQFSNIDLTKILHKKYSWLKRSNNSITILIQEMYQTQHLFSTWFNEITQAFENHQSRTSVIVASESFLPQNTKRHKALSQSSLFFTKLNESFSSLCQKLIWIYDDEAAHYQLNFKHESYDIVVNGNQGGKGKAKAKVQTVSKQILIAFFSQQLFTKSDTLEIHENSIRFCSNKVSSTTLNRLKNPSQCFRGLEKFLEQNTPKAIEEKPVREKPAKNKDTQIIVKKLKVAEPGSSSNGDKNVTSAPNNGNRIKNALDLAESLRVMLKDIFNDYSDYIHQENAHSVELSYLYKDRLLFLLFILSGEYLQELSYAYHLEKQHSHDLQKQDSQAFHYVTDPDMLYSWCLYILKGVKTVSNKRLIELVKAICITNDKIELPSLPKNERVYLSRYLLASCITSELAELQRLTNIKHDAVKDLRSKLIEKPYDAYEILAHILSLITYVNKFYPLFKNQPEIQKKLSVLFSETKQLRNMIRHHPEQLFTKQVSDSNSLGQFMKIEDKPFESPYQYNPDLCIINETLKTLRNLDNMIESFDAIINELHLNQKSNGTLDDKAGSSNGHPIAKNL